MQPARNCEEPGVRKLRLLPLHIDESPVAGDPVDGLGRAILIGAASFALGTSLLVGFAATGTPAYALSLVPGATQCPMGATAP